MDNRADYIIDLFNREKSSDCNFRTLWQDTSDLVLPRLNQIIKQTTAGEEKFKDIFNTTPIQCAKIMASGLSGMLVPSGQEFFAITPQKKTLMRNEGVSRWMARATEIAHERIFESNFILQLNENLLQNIVFGTSNLYSEWNMEILGLNYRNQDIGTYCILENYGGIVDTVILEYRLTARQALQQFGGNCPKRILDEMREQKNGNREYDFLHFVGPRKERNANYQDIQNKAVESLYIFVADKEIVEIGGFDEMPFAVPRWSKSSREKWGRGIGTDSLPAIRQLQQMERDLTECGNKWNNPPLEVLESFEGRVRVSPGAENRVMQLNSIKPITGATGNFPYTKEMVERKENEIKQAFFLDIFAQFSQLTGDRRTTTEIRERKNEGIRRIGMPVLRYQAELLTQTLTRSILLLIRNGEITDIPQELVGTNFGIEYKGELALALRDQQARGFIQFAQFVGEMESLLPGSIDSISGDRAIPRMARAFGVNVEDLATEEEKMQKRQMRQEKQRAAEQMQASLAMAQGYKDTSQSPQSGSPAQKVMEEVGV